jgi:hypothetical protein
MARRGPKFTGPRLAPLILLRTAPTITAAEIMATLNVSRQNLFLWRTNFEFPIATSWCGKTTISETDAVAAWIVRHGSTVKWI